MAMASLQTQSSTGLLGSHGKLTKSRNRLVVKPILKKLHVHSHSERNSLDLDRGWDDQPISTTPEIEYTSLDYGARDADGLGADRRHLFGSSYTAAPAATAGKGAKAARDVSFTLSATDLGGGTAARTNTYSSSHARSTSGASVATSTSGGRIGSFVHPFQQTPRTSTPPLLSSYANSVASLDTTLVGQQREYSSTIAEGDGDDEDDEGDKLDESLSLPYHSATAAAKKLHSPHLNSNPNPRRPSLTTSQRTSSLSDGTSLQVTATRSNSGAAVPCVTQSTVNHSRLDLQPSSVSSTNDSALSGAAAVAATTTAAAATPLTITAQKVSSPSLCSSSPISTFRPSLDMNGFRIRSRSEIDTATRQEHVREARRKFEAKEREKEEKYAREQVRKRERADAKEAQKYERAQAQLRKSSLGNHSRLSSERNLSGSQEKGVFDQNTSASPDDVHFEMPSRSKSAKRKTNGVFTAFMLWFRTRLLKLGRR